MAGGEIRSIDELDEQPIFCGSGPPTAFVSGSRQHLDALWSLILYILARPLIFMHALPRHCVEQKLNRSARYDCLWRQSAVHVLKDFCNKSNMPSILPSTVANGRTYSK